METMVGPRRRRSELSAVASGTGAEQLPAAQIVSQLTLARMDQLKNMISRERTQFNRLKKEIEMTVNGQNDHQLHSMLMQAMK